MLKPIYIVSPVLLIGSAAICYAALLYRKIKKYRKIPGPKAKGLTELFFGYLKKVNEGVANGIPFPEQACRNFKEFNSNTVKFRLINRIVVFTRDPKVIKAVLIDQNCLKDKYFFGIIAYPYSERFMGHGLFSETNTEKWKHDRAIFNPGFHKEVLKSFMKEFNSKVDILMQYLRTVAESDNNQICLLEVFNKTALDAIASVAFSMNVDSINDPNNKFNSMIYESLSGLQNALLNQYVAYNPFKWKEIAKYRQTIKELREIGRLQIVNRIEAFKNGDILPDDILTTILKSLENEDFSIENIVDQFITFFIAGQETTANTLASAFLEIGRNEEVLRKLRDEIDREIGLKTYIDYEDLSRLKYTGCVFKEALRLYPAAQSLIRNTSDDIVTDEFTIPKGTTMSLSIYGAHRNEEYFPDALSFKPERFSSENANKIANYTYFPFGMGSRNCIGQNFAQIEGKIVIAKFIQNFDFQLDMNQSFDLHLAFTLRPKDGTRGKITLRK